MTKPQIRVLIVEDDLVDRMACRRALAQNPDYEFVLFEAETGREGLQLAHAQKPDCILLDYHLPGMNGLEFLAELKNDLGEFMMPVIMLTGAGNAAVAVDAMKCGAQDYLVKDVDRQYLELLPAVIQRVLRERQTLMEKNQAVKLLSSSEHKYRTVVELAGDAIFLVDTASSTIIDCNLNATKLIGKPKEEIIGFHQSELHPPDKAWLYKKIFKDHIESGKEFVEEVLVVHKDGHTILVDIHATVFELDGAMVILGVFRDMTERKRAEKQLRSLTAHLQSVREEEKSSIAREIHDDMGGTLTALKMEVFWLAEELSEIEQAAPLFKHIELMGQFVDNATSAMRRIITGLRPSMLDDLGLLAAIEWHAAQFQKNTGIECQLDCALDKNHEKYLHKTQSTHLFRILQEALTNVSRHSHASRVAVEMHCSDREITLSISDNGCGVPENHVVASNSYGMLGMNERVEQLGGTIKFGSPPSGGYNVTVSLPLAANA